ncbi:MAG: hypothetical protein PVH87_22205 [Desulfobacteraceae bacterium]
MDEKELSKESRNRFHQDMVPPDRRCNDRRKNPCEGFTYVSTVGWICRRERSRRKNHHKEC